jgi:hypothetical protein
LKKVALLAFVSSLAAACGEAPSRVPFKNPNNEPKGTNEFLDQELGLCSATDTVLTCSNGQSIVLPPTFPHSKNCNQCVTKVENGVVKVKCPNGLSFEFTSIKGDKGDKGSDGSSCSVTADGWVKCTDGTSYKLLQGPKGDKGDTGNTGANGSNGKDGVAGKDGKDGKDGVGCTLGENSAGQTTITCGSTTKILVGCGGAGCWSYGAKGNVYRLPSNTSTLPDFTPMTPVAVAVSDRFDVPNRQSSLGMPYTYTPNFTDTEYYGIRFSGFIELSPDSSNKVCFKLTSDDGAKFLLGTSLTEVVSMPNLQSPTSKVSCLLAAPGWHQFRLDWFQGPKTQIALQLEVSYDNGSTYRLVDKDELKFEVK